MKLRQSWLSVIKENYTNNLNGFVENQDTKLLSFLSMEFLKIYKGDYKQTETKQPN